MTWEAGDRIIAINGVRDHSARLEEELLERKDCDKRFVGKGMVWVARRLQFYVCLENLQKPLPFQSLTKQQLARFHGQNICSRASKATYSHVILSLDWPLAVSFFRDFCALISSWRSEVPWSALSC
eukprot:3895712-Amphidinium_carterae.1